VRPAEHHARAPRDDAEGLVRGAVEVVLVQDLAAPVPAPAVGAEERFAGSGVGRGLDAVVDQYRQRAVGDRAVVGEAMRVGDHGPETLSPSC
jgi:hypothetical protein